MKFFYTLLFSLFFSIIVGAQEYYNEVNLVDTGVAIVQKKEKYGVTKSGNLIIPIEIGVSQQIFYNFFNLRLLD